MRERNSNKPLDRLLLEQSSEWLEALKRDEQDVNGRFVDWVSESPRHVRAQLFMVALDEELGRIDPERKIPVPAVGVGSSVSVLPGISSKAPRALAAAPRWSWAAMLVLGLGVFLSFWMRSVGWTEYETAVGEQRGVELADGSFLHLNTGSRVEVRVTESARDIRLISGEALFKVHHDTSRPFRVYTSNATITAVGTQFNVYQRSEGTKVSVLEGRVRVDAGRAERTEAPAPSAAEVDQRLLAAGEEADIGNDGQIARQPVADVSSRAAWTRRQLVFKQEPLANVIQQFNRYKKVPQFRIEDEALAARKYSGVFDVDDPQSLEALLAAEGDVEIEKLGDATVIRLRGP